MTTQRKTKAKPISKKATGSRKTRSLASSANTKSSRASSAGELCITPFVTHSAYNMAHWVNQQVSQPQDAIWLSMATMSEYPDRPGVYFQRMPDALSHDFDGQSWLFSVGEYNATKLCNDGLHRYRDGLGHDFVHWLQEHTIDKIHLYGLRPFGSEILYVLRDAKPEAQIILHLDDLEPLHCHPDQQDTTGFALEPSLLRQQNRSESAQTETQSLNANRLTRFQIKIRREKLLAHLAHANRCMVKHPLLAEWLKQQSDRLDGLQIELLEDTSNPKLSSYSLSDNTQPVAILLHPLQIHEWYQLMDKMQQQVDAQHTIANQQKIYVFGCSAGQQTDKLRAQFPSIQYVGPADETVMAELMPRCSKLVVMDNGWRSIDQEQAIQQRYDIPAIERW